MGLLGHRVLPLNEAETRGSGMRPPGGHISTGGFWLLLEPQPCGRELRVCSECGACSRGFPHSLGVLGGPGAP